MKILWMSDSPDSASGYGNLTKFICRGLARFGHNVSIIGWQTHGRPEQRYGCMLYPAGEHSFGADVILDYLRRLRPDVLITQGDLWRLTFIANPIIAEFMREARIPWACYYTVDSDMGQGRLPDSLVRMLKTLDLPIAVSRYCSDVSRANGITPAYIPNGVDARVFRPPKSKTEAKQAVGYANKFVVLCDARNQLRKLLPRLLEIFRRFAADKPDALLHLHCDPHDSASRSDEYSYDIESDVAFLRLGDKVRFTAGMSLADGGLPLHRLAAIYQAADVHLLTSYGEGFGLPTLQAAASGAVPLATDYSTSRELVLGHGEAIRVRHFVTGPMQLRCALVDIADAVDKLDRLYSDRRFLHSKSRASRRFGKGYDWKEIIPLWHELLEREVPRLQDGLAHSRPRLAVSSRNSEKLPRKMQSIVDKLERLGGKLSAELVRDMVTLKGDFTIPVALPRNGASNARIAGRIYLATKSDIGVFERLRCIFPNLTSWPAADLRASSRKCLQSSVVALDLQGAIATLPTAAARAGVPCIGFMGNKAQARLWPRLSVQTRNTRIAAQLARWMLTDHGDAAELCALAKERLQDATVHSIK